MRGYVVVPFLLAAILAVVAPTHARPVLLSGDTVRLTDGPGTTGGGEFLMTVNSDWSFITFCLQRTEYIDFSHTFTIDSISAYTLTDPAVNGGDAQGRDHISAQTAYLYTMFRNGSLVGYDYTGTGRAASANKLQNAFWMFEQELAMVSTNPFVQLANQAVSGGQWSGIGNVRVLNLSRNGVEAQDQLALVPEPSTLMMLGSGFVAAIARLRRTRKGERS
jgi:hypothetical protein